MFFMTVEAQDSRKGAFLDECIRKMAGGDKDALKVFYEKTSSAVYGFALSVLKNTYDAEDVLQDTYIQVWRASGNYRADGRAMAWLMTITRNLAYDCINTKSQTELLSEEDWKKQIPDSSAVTNEDRLVLQSLLAHLGEQDRQIVVLHAMTGLKHREIASLLSIPLPTVLSKYNRAIKKLQLVWNGGNHE